MRIQATVTNSTPPTIGLFDSGVGGLTVLRALVDRIPAANYLYFGDTARLPYGSKSVATVARYAVEAAHYLESHGADLLVIACNPAYRKALEARTLRAHEKACPLLVPLVEEGWVEHSVTEQVARIYLAEAFADGFRDADTLVLGCTHYPLLKPLLRRVAPEHVSIVDSAESTARAVASHLQQLGPATGGAEGRRALPGTKFF